MSENSKKKVNKLNQALGIDSVKLQAALGRTPPFQRDQPEYQCKLVFQVWKESTQSPTYGALRSALDKYSVFCGRNPLVSCELVQEVRVAIPLELDIVITGLIVSCHFGWYVCTGR